MSQNNGNQKNVLYRTINAGISPDHATLIAEAMQAKLHGHTEISYFATNLVNQNFKPEWKDRFYVAKESAQEIGIWPW